jgi:DNA-binding NarL/FixJ family response regulator
LPGCGLGSRRWADSSSSLPVLNGARGSSPGSTHGESEAIAEIPEDTACSSRISVAVIDDHPLYREGVVEAVTRIPCCHVVAEGADKVDAIRIAREHSPDLMLLDIGIPGNGIEAAAEIARLCPTVKIIFLTASDTDTDVFCGLEIGGRGYVLKSISGSELGGMLMAVHRGEVVITPELAGRLLSTANLQAAQRPRSASPSQLTAREDEIIDRVTDGMTNKEVAIALGLTEKTVKHYMTIIMQKLHVRNRVEAAMIRRAAGPRSGVSK